MKKLISTVLFAVFGFVMISCDVFTTENPDENPDKNPNQMHEIEALCNDFNVDMKILETLVNSIQTRDTVSQFSPLVEDGEEVGYIVTFVNAGTVIIRYGANSEYVPKLGFKCDDSDEYFWTIDGEWLLDDNGNKVPASGASKVVPQFKVEENYWCISFDGGENWIRLDKTIDGVIEDGVKAVFKNVYSEDDYLYVVLADDTVLQLPCEVYTEEEGPFDPDQANIIFDIKNGYPVVPDTYYTLNFTLYGVDEYNKVVVISPEKYVFAEVEYYTPLTGAIHLYVESAYFDSAYPDKNMSYDEQKIVFTILVTEPDTGKELCGKTLTVTRGLIESVEDTYLVGAEGGEVTVEVKTNVEYDVIIPESSPWISYNPDTKAKVRTDKQVLTVQPNTSDTFRTAIVKFGDSLAEMHSIHIIQRSPVAGSEMTFKDESVKRACVDAFDANLDGILTYEEAAEVKSLIPLRMPEGATSFDELKHFTSVTRIPSEKFKGMYFLTSITLPESLTSIGSGAFFGTSIETINIPSRVTSIGFFDEYDIDPKEDVGVFAHSAIKEIVIPDHVTSLNTYRMFDNCTSLVSASIPDIAIIDYAMFASCLSLKNFEMPPSLWYIGNVAFIGCLSLTSVVLPENVYYIGDTAFSNAGISGTLEIPESVDYVGNSAFIWCRNLDKIVFKSETPCATGEDIFKPNTVIYVPDGCYDAYRDAWAWQKNSIFYTWGDKYEQAPIIIDGKFSDWDNIDPSLISSCILPDDSFFNTLQEAKVYADTDFIKIYFKFNMSVLKDTYTELYILMDSNSEVMNPGYNGFWPGTYADYLLVGELDVHDLLGDGTAASYDPLVGKLRESGSYSSTNSGLGISYGTGGKGEYEMMISRALLKKYCDIKTANKFSLGFLMATDEGYTGMLPYATEMLGVTTIK